MTTGAKLAAASILLTLTIASVPASVPVSAPRSGPASNNTTLTTEPQQSTCASVPVLEYVNANFKVPDRQVVVSPTDTEAKVVSLGKASVRVTPSAVKRPVGIGITALSKRDLPALESGMTNVTGAEPAGYRFTPHPMQFNEPLYVIVPYDPAAIPEGFTPQDIYTYFWDEGNTCWQTIYRVEVDEVNHWIVSRVDHFTTMINATVMAPEHPEGASFDPNQLSGIQAANPGAGVNLLASPAANNQGVNRLAYPIEIPPGRTGLQPGLGVSYDSSAGNGWMGMGWDLPMPAITVDTRWGVPRYSAAEETETYLLNGAQLTPVAHRGPVQPRTSEKVFHTRVEGAFARIVRHGDSPANYTWEVTDKSGTRWLYGGDAGAQAPAADSTLTDAPNGQGGNVFMWALREVRDTNGNTIRYQCVRVEDPGVDGGFEPGRNLYPKRITYTGDSGSAGRYAVTFVRDRELNEPLRVDKSIDARGGFKRVNADLLRRIDVTLDSTLIRRYEFTYRTGAFYKTLLNSIAQYDDRGALFNTHQLDYFDDIRDGAGNYQAFQRRPWGSPADGLRNGALNLTPSQAGNASALHANTSVGGGGHLYVGVSGITGGGRKSGSVGVKTGFGHHSDEGLLALVDVDGDTLPDKVFRSGSTIKYRKNLSGPNGELRFADQVTTLNLPGIMSESSNSLTIGVEGYLGGVAAQLDFVNTFATTSQYFSDVNGDGITDLVNGSTVLFGRVGANGVPVYGISGDTPVPVGAGQVDGNGLFDAFAADRARLNASFPLLDTVRRWVAPYDGTVKVEGAVRLAEATAAARAASANADGVRVAIQREDTELWSEQVGARDNGEHVPAGVGSVSVTKGQRLYFRVQSRDDGTLDQVSWDPIISYLNVPSTLDVNGLPAERYQASRDFTLGGRSAKATVPLTGTMRLTGDLRKAAATSDDVTVVVTRDGTPVFEQTLAANATGTIPVNLDLAVQKGQTLSWRVRVDSPIDLGQISWAPHTAYIAADGVDQIVDGDGKPLIAFDPPYQVDMYPDDGLSNPQTPYLVRTSGAHTVTPALSFAFGGAQPTARVAFTVKRRNVLLGKGFFDINNGQVSSPQPVTVEATAGEELFFDFSTTDPSLRQFLTAQSAQVSVNGQASDATTAFHSAVQEAAFPQPYRGWGAIGYHGNGDRADRAIAQGDLVIDDNFASQLPSSVDPQAQKDAFAADPKIDPPKVTPFLPNPARDRWEAGQNSWVAKDGASSSRMGADSVDLPSPSDFAGATAVPRMSRSQQISVTGSVGGSVGSVGGSIATGDSTGQVDFLDMNGDGFPDVVGAGGIQYTNPNGALGSTRGLLPDGAVRRSSNVTGNASAGSAARTIPTGRGHAAPPGHTDAATSQSGNDMPPFSVGGNLGTSTSDGQFDLLDVNGDNLPDRVYADGRVALNLGYRFGAAETWRNPAPLNDGSGANFGLNIGFNTDFYGFAGGASYSQGTNSSAATLMDMNGDGLMDRVFEGNPITVALNTGNGFQPPVPFNGSLSGINGDRNAKLGGGAYFTIPICFVVVCVIINPGGDFSVGANRSEQQLRDIDGDGYTDHLSSTRDDELVVAENKTGRTNLLRSVSRPLGARMDFDYARDGNTYNQPQSRWVLSRVAVNDGHPGDGQDVQLATYEYRDGVFDRLEREFYGYGTVTERHRDPGAGEAVYRIMVRQFRTDGYYTRGLATREVTQDAAGRMFLETEHSYLLRDVADPTATADPRSTSATVFPQLVRSDRRFYEGQPTPGKTSFTTMEYDAFGNMTRSFDAAEPGAADDLDTRMRYTASDPACQATYIVGTANMIDVFGGGTLMRHRESTVDCGSGDITQVRAKLANGDTAVTDMSYFPNGNLKSVVNPPNERGQRYRMDYTYDTVVNTHIESTVDSFGYRSTSTHNFKFGTIESTTDINNQTVRNVYDSVGRPDTVTGPYEAGSGRVTIDFEYHPEAPVPYAITRHIDRQADGALKPDTMDTISFIDGLRRPVQTKKDASLHTGPDTTPADSMIVSGRVKYDFLGRPVEQYYPVTEPKGTPNTAFNSAFDTVTPTRLGYDVLDRSTRVALPDETFSTMAYGFGPDRAGVTQFETVTTDGAGKVKRAYRDIRDLTTSVKEFNPAGGQPVIWTSHAYDPMGQLTSTVDDRQNATTAIYDNFGRRTVVNNPDTGRTETVYDLDGNVIRKITAKLAGQGLSIAYDYDFNRLSAIRYPLFTANNVTYTYGAPGAAHNGADRITNVTDGAGTVAREYGPLGEITKETRTTPVQGSQVVSFTTEYRFDTWNRMLRMTFPDGEVLSYRYNSGGLVDQATGAKGTFSYEYLRRMDYDKFEQRVLHDTGNGTRTRFTYNAADRRLDNLQAVLGTGYVFQNLNYTYDDVGNVTSISNNTVAPSDPDVGMQVGGPSTQTFRYDDLYRLTHAEGSYQPRTPRTDRYSIDLTYDSIHNITNKTQSHQFVSDGQVSNDAKLSYNYNYTYGGSRPHAPTSLGIYTINYDANGNQISREQQPKPRRQMIWDEENRLACSHENVQSQTLPQTPSSCDNAGGTPNAARYKYDDQGDRVVKDGAQFHVYPNQSFSTRGNKQFKHIYIGGSKLVTKYVEPNRLEDRQYFTHSDQLASTGFVTDARGGLAEHLQYFPGGETWVSEHPSQPVPQQFTGKEFDPETNLYYFGARYYDPRTQQWQSPDPAMESYLDGSPNGGVFASMNLASYTYAANNPVTLTDPDGRSWRDFARGVVKGAAVGLVAGVVVGAMIAAGGPIAVVGAVVVVYGAYKTYQAGKEVITGKDSSGRKLSSAERHERAGELVGGVLTGGRGGRIGIRVGTRVGQKLGTRASPVAAAPAPKTGGTGGGKVGVIDTRPAVGKGPSKAYQVAQTGPCESLCAGGGKTVWADGVENATTLLDAKFVGNADRSPFVPGSNMPAKIRAMINAKTESEFSRYAAVIDDPGSPFTGLRVITNEPGAVPYFRGLMNKYGIKGTVVVKE